MTKKKPSTTSASNIRNVKNVGDYQLSTKVIKQMDSALKQTNKTGLEHGFSLCAKKTKGKIFGSNLCTGDECSIAIDKGCDSENLGVRIGSYHTHPSDSPNGGLSLGDINIACSNNLEVSCLGHGSKINCYTLKKFKDEAQEEKQLKHCRLKSQVDGQIYEDKIRNVRRAREMHFDSNLQLENELEELNKKQTEVKTEKEKVMKEYNKLTDSEVTISKRYSNRINKLTPKYFDKVEIK